MQPKGGFPPIYICSKDTENKTTGSIAITKEKTKKEFMSHLKSISIHEILKQRSKNLNKLK